MNLNKLLFNQGDTVRLFLSDSRLLLNGIIVSNALGLRRGQIIIGTDINYVFLILENYSKCDSSNIGNNIFLCSDKYVSSQKINLIEKIHPYFKLKFF
jgi:hypothetical protein